MGDEASTTAATTSTFGPLFGIISAVEKEVLPPSMDIGVKAISIGCEPKEKNAVAACYLYDETATTPAKKEACHKAADELRSCLHARVNMIKALAAAWAGPMNDEE
ncbi:unnamed protein product [Alopecurus aequalis]